MEQVSRHHIELIPVDSEHSAIWQCLLGVNLADLQKIILTCSGGPFFGQTRSSLAKKTVTATLKHPTWQMGAKISIDSATLMNKGLEIIEAHYLFNQPFDKIEVAIHPQSYVHSLIELVDGTQLAQMSNPDMQLPIQLALSFPSRWSNPALTNNLFQFSPLTFSQPDRRAFGCLRLAEQAGRAGQSASIILNSANEIAVAAFLANKIKFLQIESLIDAALNQVKPIPINSLSDVFQLDHLARLFAQNYLSSFE